MVISVFVLGVFLILFGILSIPYKKVFAILYRMQYLNALNGKYSELFALFMSPVWIVTGILLILHSIK